MFGSMFEPKYDFYHSSFTTPGFLSKTVLDKRANDILNLQAKRKTPEEYEERLKKYKEYLEGSVDISLNNIREIELQFERDPNNPNTAKLVQYNIDTLKVEDKDINLKEYYDITISFSQKFIHNYIYSNLKNIIYEGSKNKINWFEEFTNNMQKINFMQKKRGRPIMDKKMREWVLVEVIDNNYQDRIVLYYARKGINRLDRLISTARGYGDEDIDGGKRRRKTSKKQRKSRKSRKNRTMKFW
jgi:hypothetical protein